MGRWDVVAEKLQHACTLSGIHFRKINVQRCKREVSKHIQDFSEMDFCQLVPNLKSKLSTHL
jgi:hypothetical protein